ncbi:phospholipase D-like domain-containing protein [Amaricoccus macauensis]|uniref:phospholipase D-like domain-containing protein n=1 Tax=Amaricoccus macauensis TaxID=57001 RepID=UPI003C7D1D7F
MTESSLIRPGETVWQSASAARFAFIVDAADFFFHAKRAMLSAKHSVYLIGWDFDARIELEPEGQTLEGPNQIGSFLNWLSKERPEVDLRVLKWDVGLLHSLSRGETPAFLFYWRIRQRIELRLDSAHPPASAHHMKLLVVDDSLAFCGGIDMTEGRWDTRAHEPGRDGRRDPSGGEELKPWHDATSCVSGPAARLLGDLARERWERATGDEVVPVDDTNDIWPEGLDPQFENIEIGVARTIPEYKNAPQVSEVEKATLAILESVQRTLYIESQYLASRRIAETMAKRLKEAEGPEIVVVCPRDSEGWLEPKAMDSARARMIELLRRADHDDRFRIYYPVNAGDQPIYVHAKVMIADDRVFKVGSANLNNRSMGYDTECDILIEGETPEEADQILAMRNDLVAEHLACDVQDVSRAIEKAGGSLVRAIDALNPKTGRRLLPIRTEEHSYDEEMLAESDAADPIRPVSPFEALMSLFRTFRRKR